MLCNTGHVSPQAGPKVRIMEERHPVFGAEHHVEDDVGMELGHGRELSRPAGPLHDFSARHPGFRSFLAATRAGLFRPFRGPWDAATAESGRDAGPAGLAREA